jgi:hypothetical protein
MPFWKDFPIDETGTFAFTTFPKMWSSKKLGGKGKLNACWITGELRQTNAWTSHSTVKSNFQGKTGGKESEEKATIQTRGPERSCNPTSYHTMECVKVEARITVGYRTRGAVSL